MDEWLKEHLVCPREHNSLELENNQLLCPAGDKYPVIDGIPIMLLEEVATMHGDCWKTFEQVTSSHNLPQFAGEVTDEKPTLDPYVQRMVAGTCGLMYKSLIGKLDRYPIPKLPLPPATGQNLLDIGCGWGRWCISAAERGYSPVGIDPSLDAVRAARKVAQQLGAPMRYVVADALHLPFASTSFDVVFSYSVLQHFDKELVRLCLGEIGRVLKPSGFSLIQMPNRFGLRNLYHQFRRGFREPTTFEYPRYWSLSELRNVFSSLIGSTSIRAEGYFALGVIPNDAVLLPLKYRVVISCSERLRKISEKVRWMDYLADSLYVSSSKDSAICPVNYRGFNSRGVS